MKIINKDTKKALMIAIIIGTLGGLTAIGMFSLSGLMLSRSAFKVPLYTLMVLVATIKLFGVLRAFARYFERLVSHEATFTMLKDIRVETFERLVSDFVNLHAKWQLSTLLERTVNDIEKLQNILLRVIYPPVVALLTTIIVCIIYAFYSIAAVLVIIAAMGIILGVLPFIFSRYMARLTTESEAARSAFMKRLADYQLGREDIDVFDQTGRYLTLLEENQLHYERSVVKEKRAVVFYDFLLNSMSMLAIWGVLYVMAGNTNTMMYASVVMVTITLFELAIPMTNFPFYHQETKRALMNVSSLAEHEPHAGLVPTELLPLELDHLSFTYAGQQRPTLKDISLKVTAGQKVGIIGSSGSGKTTLLHLLAGLYESDMTAASVPLSQLDREAYFKQLNVMQQHNHFFQGTVQENLFSADQDKVNTYLKMLNLSFTADSELNEFGAQLSGGERRRLHFIRMLLRESRLWLLDEPFNGVDVLNRSIMLNKLLTLDATVILISHDVNVLKDFDIIYVMEEGRLTAKGSYHQLHSTGRFKTAEQHML
ncbi:ATP-binding cassette domain-containing protein [Macrococcus equipercicus]|uniref:ATP-binding cassette domain-containing protein n=1 Tax=Macrococcus equipercicus TaxID=69967 RepID=A0ABQ6RB31_9STAP|nr:ATP-binding cassette domain-containing protein [Macrococcus equipercicus]KAA1042403.1 ATP-binding cassette domain-containing protein [Macrococcus equipercicus]